MTQKVWRQGLIPNPNNFPPLKPETLSRNQNDTRLQCVIGTLMTVMASGHDKRNTKGEDKKDIKGLKRKRDR